MNRRFEVLYRSMTTLKMSSAPLLNGVTDPYGGVTIDLGKEIPTDDARNVQQFADVLQRSVAAWTEQKKRGLWLRIPTSHAHLLGAAVDEGFQLHHAQPKYVVRRSCYCTGSLHFRKDAYCSQC